MSFRVRVGFLSGTCVLQHGDMGKWVDTYPTPELKRGFRIVTDAYLDELLERNRQLQSELNEIRRTRSRAAKEGWAKKRAPVLPMNQSIYTSRVL
jgi:hypothetical protein